MQRVRSARQCVRGTVERRRRGVHLGASEDEVAGGGGALRGRRVGEHLGRQQQLQRVLLGAYSHESGLHLGVDLCGRCRAVCMRGKWHGTARCNMMQNARALPTPTHVHAYPMVRHVYLCKWGEGAAQNPCAGARSLRMRASICSKPLGGVVSRLRHRQPLVSPPMPLLGLLLCAYEVPCHAVSCRAMPCHAVRHHVTHRGRVEEAR